MIETTLVRDNPMIDPQLHIWGWEIPVYLFLGGLTAGLMIMSALLSLRAAREERSRALRWLPFAGPALLSLGMLALFLDLAYPLHVLRFYAAFMPASPMSWGSWILIAVYPATLLAGLAGLTADEVARLAAWRPVAALRLGGLLRGVAALAGRHERAVMTANVALGIGLAVYTGILLSTLGGARAAWSSALLGPIFLVSGASTGAALMMLFPLREAEHHALTRWDMGAIGAEVALLVLFFVGLVSGGTVSQGAASLFLGGAFTAPFWALVVVAGLLAPLVLEAIEVRRGLRATVMAPVLVLAGGFALRWILVSAGQV